MRNKIILKYLKYIYFNLFIKLFFLLFELKKKKKKHLLNIFKKSKILIFQQNFFKKP